MQSRKVIVATTALFITFANAVFNPAGLSQPLAALLAGLTTSYTAGNVLANGNDRPEAEKMYSTKFLATMAVMIFCSGLDLFGLFTSSVSLAVNGVMPAYNVARGWSARK